MDLLVASGHQYHKPPFPGLPDQLHQVLQATKRCWGRLRDDRVEDVREREQNRVEDMPARRCLLNERKLWEGDKCKLSAEWKQFVKSVKYSEFYVFSIKTIDLIDLINLHTFTVRCLINLGENLKFNEALQGRC